MSDYDDEEVEPPHCRQHLCYRYSYFVETLSQRSGKEEHRKNTTFEAYS